MRRVIYAWNYLEWGGAQIHFLALIKEVRKHFDVLVVLPEGSSKEFLAFLDELEVRYEFFSPHTDIGPATSLRRKLERHGRKLRSEYAMVKTIRRFSAPDSIVHVDLAPNQSLAALLSLSLRNIVFTTAHNALPKVGHVRDILWRTKFGIMSLFRNFNIFCSNQDARNYFRKYYSKAVGDRIEVTYTSIDPSEIDRVLASELERTALLDRLDIPSGRPIILAVGQFVDRKGRWVFLEAAREVLRQHDALFLWVTPTLPNEEDRRRIDTYGLGDAFRIVLSNSVGTRRSEVLNFFRVADVFALPSFVEGLPIALLEAMALGIPSVSTNVNGIPEAIKDHETGRLVEAGNATALASVVSDLLVDRETARALGRTGRVFVREHFDEREVARKVVACYLNTSVKN